MPCMLSRDANLPRFLVYMADNAAMGRDIYIHNFVNGSAVVPMMQASHAASLLSQQILSSVKVNRILHISNNLPNLSLAELGDEIASRHNISCIKSPVDRVVLSGKFSTKYSLNSCQETSSPYLPFDLLSYMDAVIRDKRRDLKKR